MDIGLNIHSNPENSTWYFNLFVSGWDTYSTEVSGERPKLNNIHLTLMEAEAKALLVNKLDEFKEEFDNLVKKTLSAIKDSDNE